MSGPEHDSQKVIFRSRDEFTTFDDWAFSFWDTILAFHRMGGKVEKRHVVSLLRRGEPVPAEAQAFLAEYLEPGVKKQRGAPAKPNFLKEIDRAKKARAFVEEIDRCRKQGTTLQGALSEYAQTHEVSNLDSVTRTYWAAKKLTRQQDDALARALGYALQLGLLPTPDK
jgi:hypothetical protein